MTVGMRYIEIRILGDWDIRILGYWDIRILGYWDIRRLGDFYDFERLHVIWISPFKIIAMCSVFFQRS